MYNFGIAHNQSYELDDNIEYEVHKNKEDIFYKYKLCRSATRCNMKSIA